MKSFTTFAVFVSLSLAFGTLASGCAPIEEMDGEDMAAQENVASDSQALTGTRVMPLKPRHAPAKCLDVSNYSYVNGANVILWDCNGGASQQMTLKDVGGGYYTIRPQHSGKCLTVKNGATNWGAEIVQEDCNGSIHQLFRLTYKEANNYEIRTAQMNHCLDLSNNSSASGTRLVQWYCNGGYNQQFFWSVPNRTGAERDACSADPSICKTNLTDASYFQCIYGYRVGSGWGWGTRVYDEIDRCAYWHDNGCWSFNFNSGADEGNGGCTQTVNFISCVEKIMPESIEEAQAKDCIMQSFLRFGADTCEPSVPRGSYYPLYSGNTLTATKPGCGISWR